MSNSVRTTSGGVAPNARRLLVAGFMAILAAGIGFGIRGGILANWAAEFGFTGAQLGDIGGAGFTSFCFGIIIGGVVVDKIGYGKLIVAAFLFHMLSALVTFGATTGQDQGTAYMFLYIGTFLFGAGQWNARSGRKPARVDALPGKPHALSQHPSCELAGRPGARRPRRMDPRGRHASELEAAARAVSRPDGALRRGVPRPEVPEVGGFRQGSQPRRDAPGSRSARRARGVRPRGPLLQGSTGRSSRVLHGQPLLHFGGVGLSGVGRRGGLADRRRHQHEFLDRIPAALRALHHARAARLGRARHRQLDSEHHRQHPDAGARARSCSSSPRC